MAAVSQKMSFSCQYPPPEILEQYNGINPELVNTIISQRDDAIVLSGFVSVLFKSAIIIHDGELSAPIAKARITVLALEVFVYCFHSAMVFGL
jgi:uncharacterized membrane protein